MSTIDPSIPIVSSDISITSANAPKKTQEAQVKLLNALSQFNSPISSGQAPTPEQLKNLSDVLKELGGKPGDNEFQVLKPVLEKIAAKVKADPEFKTENRERIINAFNGLKALYHHFRPNESGSGMVKRNDILEGLGVAFQKDKGINDLLKLDQKERITRVSSKALQRLASSFTRTEKFETLKRISQATGKPLSEVRRTFKNLNIIIESFKTYDILLIEYEDIPEAKTLIEEAKKKNGGVDLTADQMQQVFLKHAIVKAKQEKAAKTPGGDPDKIELKPEEIIEAFKKHNVRLKKEGGALDKGIDLLYKHAHLLPIEKLNQFITKQRESLKSTEGITATVIAEFFKSLHITVETDLKGELYAYSETYVNDLRSEVSRDEAFQRKLSPLAEDILFQESRELQTDIEDTVGAGEVVIANSFNRLSHYSLEAGDSTKQFALVGKLLELSQANISAADMETVLHTSFGFSVASLLGCKPEEVKQALPAIKAEFLKEQAKADPAMARRKADTLALGLMARVVNKQAYEMYIQRLAPEDIHHYAASINGRVLNRKDSLVAMEKMLKKKDTPGLTPAERAEIAQLEELRGYFKGDEGDSAFISVKGTLASVSRAALAHRSQLLATNDRHVMMVEGRDGSISFHVFIGATAVDAVNVTAQVGEAKQGEDFGSMGAGKSKEFTGPKGVSATDQREIASIRMSRGVGEVRTGDDQGDFTVGGSTVISLLPSRQFQPSSEMAGFSDIGRHRLNRFKIANAFRSSFGLSTIPEESRSIEVKAALGNVIGQPTSILTFNTVKKVIGGKEFEKFISEELVKGTSESGILKALKGKFLVKFNKQISSKPAGMTDQEFAMAKKIYRTLGKSLSAGKTDDDSSLISIMDQAITFNLTDGFILNTFKQVLGKDQFKELFSLGKNSADALKEAFNKVSDEHIQKLGLGENPLVQAIRAGKDTPLLGKVDKALNAKIDRSKPPVKSDKIAKELEKVL